MMNDWRLSETGKDVHVPKLKYNVLSHIFEPEPTLDGGPIRFQRSLQILNAAQYQGLVNRLIAAMSSNFQ